MLLLFFLKDGEPTQSVTAQSYHICPGWGPSPQLCSSHWSLSLQGPAEQLQNAISPTHPFTPPPPAWLKHVHNCVMWCLRDIFFFVPHIGWWDQHPEHESHHNGFVLYEIGWDINLFIHYVDFCTFSQHCLDEYIKMWCFLLLPSTIHISQHQYHEVNLFQSYLNRPLRQTIDLFD